MNLRLTEHARLKMKQRGISIEDVEEAVRYSDKTERDKIDEELVHFIEKLHSKQLRVLAKVSGDDIDYNKCVL
jgi:chromosome segregation and condensation protein ScpB